MLRIVLVGVGAYAAYLVLEPYGLGWLVLPGAVAIIAGLFLYRWVRVRRIRREIAREDAWARAVVDWPAPAGPSIAMTASRGRMAGFRRGRSSARKEAISKIPVHSLGDRTAG
jgi:hypothetical protein